MSLLLTSLATYIVERNVKNSMIYIMIGIQKLNPYGVQAKQ